MRKIEEVMPLDIPRYLADTADLDNATSGAYLHALMHQWLRGPLPNDMDQCAILMKIRGLGAKDIASAILKTFFSQDENACWIQQRGMKIKAEVTAKAIRYSERATRANAIRWSGHVAKYPKKTPTRTPSKDAEESYEESLWSPYGVPVVQVLEVQDQNGRLLRNLPGSQPQAAGPVGGTGKQVQNGSKPNGKNHGEPAYAKTPQDEPQPPETGNALPGGTKIAPTRQSSRKTEGKNGAKTGISKPRSADPRFNAFRREILTYWKAQNANGLRYGWDVADGRALNIFLRKYKTLDLQGFKNLLKNRALSEGINPAESPPRWIAQLGQYGTGPLDRYGHLL